MRGIQVRPLLVATRAGFVLAVARQIVKPSLQQEGTAFVVWEMHFGENSGVKLMGENCLHGGVGRAWLRDFLAGRWFRR